jgi:hypothetical protein
MKVNLKNKRVVSVVLAVVAGLIAFGVVTLALKKDEPLEIKNQRVSKAAFVAPCKDEAIGENGSGLPADAAQAYCECTYDRGIELYGYDEFIAKATRLGETGDLTELNDLVNECLARAYES